MTLQQTVTAQVQALEGLDLESLRSAWRARFGDPPALRSPEILRLMLACRIQAEAFGGLDGWTRRELKSRKAPPAPTHAMGAGTKITREWQGRRIEVVTTADGFLFDGTIYPSLSAIARKVTGVRWNGPRFFGLRAA